MAPSPCSCLVVTAFLLLLLPRLDLACRGLDCGMGYCLEGKDGSYRCICLGGYGGNRCDQIVATPSRREAEASPCDESPCENGGECMPVPTEEVIDRADVGFGESEMECEVEGNCYVCICTAAFAGPNCLIPVCPRDERAGVVWEGTRAGDTLAQPCQSVDDSLRGGAITRGCSLDGEWEELDYTGCTLGSGSPPFILVWVVAETNNSDRELIERNLVQLESMVFQMLMQPPNLTESTSQSLMIIDSDSVYQILFTFKIELSRDANIANVSSSFSATLAPNVTINESSIALDSLGYKGFFPSEVCSCQETEDSLRTLCTTVNNNDHTSACSCTIPQGECECQRPFYTGDGVECAVDADGDGYPNTALPSCTETATTAMYCSKDLCPATYYEENTAFPCKTEELGPSFEGCPGGEDVWGFIWPNAGNNEVVVVACPDGQGNAARSCVNGEWQMAQVLQCDSSGFVNALNEAEEVFSNDDKDLIVRLNATAAIMQEVLQLIQPREGGSHLPGDLNTTNTITSGVLTLLESTLLPGSNITANIPQQNVFHVFNTALHPNNTEGWMTLQNAKGGASMLLDSVERYGLYLSLAADDTETRRISQDENIVVAVIRYSFTSNTSSVTFPESISELQNTTYSSAIPAQITIPSDLLQERKAEGANTAPLAGTIARGMERVLLPESLGETWGVASPVISAQVAERSVKSIIPITVMFAFDTVENASEFRCAYWNFSEPVGNGEWAFDGVELVTLTDSDGTTIVTCNSTHLTSFAVLVNVAASDLSSAELQALMIVSYIGCAISLACLFFAIVFYITLWRELLSQVHYFIHLNLSIALFLAYLVFVLGIQLARESEGACIFVAALLQYLFLSAFCWMMCEGVMLYLMLVVVFGKLSKKWWFFMLLGWVPALVPVIIGLAARYREYGVENDSGELEYCWLSTKMGVIWAFVAPMLVIILINSFFLVIALVKVFQTKRRQAYDMKRMSSQNFSLFKTLFRATVVLLPILGLTWVFGLFAVNQNSSWLAWLFTIFNTLQGCFIFIVHVVLSDKFWKNSRLKRVRSYMTTTVRSSHFRSTISSTIKRSSTHDGSTFAKYSKNDDKVKIDETPTIVSESNTETTKVAVGDDDVSLGLREDDSATVIANEWSKGKDMEAENSADATTKTMESVEENI